MRPCCTWSQTCAATAIATLKPAWSAISLSPHHVRDRRSCAGSSTTFDEIARGILSAPRRVGSDIGESQPDRASHVRRDLGPAPRPEVLSPSQPQGTARSSAATPGYFPASIRSWSAQLQLPNRKTVRDPRRSDSCIDDERHRQCQNAPSRPAAGKSIPSKRIMPQQNATSPRRGERQC